MNADSGTALNLRYHEKADQKNRKQHKGRQENQEHDKRMNDKGLVVLLSGCSDSQTSADAVRLFCRNAFLTMCRKSKESLRVPSLRF